MRWPWRGRARRDAELAEELQAHLEMAVAQRIQRGESPAVARDNALRGFGNVTHVAEVTREMWGGASWDAFVRDVRYAARGLRRSPAFTAVAVATFALGIGANTAMFTVVNGALLEPLPFAHPDRLVMFSHRAVDGSNGMHDLSDHTFVELRAELPPAFASLATYSGSQMTLTGDGDAEAINAGLMTANLTTTLGVSPAIGRAFTTEEERGDDHVVLLSDQLWRECFGGATSVLGRSIILNGVYAVIGVMPPTFDLPHGVALWRPLSIRPQPNMFAGMPLVARLSTGTTIETARRELEATLAHLPSNLDIDGVSAMPKGYDVDKLVVAPGYFSTMRIQLVAGREFDRDDNASSQPVTIVSRSIAQRFWPPDGRGAIGQRVAENDDDPQPGEWRTIVGVVDDVVQQDLTHGRDHAAYVPFEQAVGMPFISNDVTFTVRTTRTAQELTPSLRAIVHELNPVVAVRTIQSLDDIAAASIADSAFETRLLTIFAALALLLAAVGTYGVLAYDVAARTHELGVRVALGALSGDVIGVVGRRTLALVIPGLALGLVGALAVTRELQKSLFEVTPTDPATLLAVSGVLFLVALFAGFGPTRRAMRVDPMTALRSE